MFNRYYGDAIEEWLIEHKKWECGTHPDLIENPDLKKEYPFYSMWNGNPPDIDFYQKVKYKPEDLTHIQLYETTSEGTPITPIFKASELEKLCEYAAEHCSVFADYAATKDEWMEMLSDGFVYHKSGNVIFT